MEQQIKFCRSADGINIAYSTVGSGPPFVKAGNWMNHLELDWPSPVWSHLLHEFSACNQLIRYDQRGTGLSDQNTTDLTLETFVADLESVVDSVGIERFTLFGISQGGPVALAYAHRHPEKVSHLILLGSFAAGWKRAGLEPGVLEKRQAQVTLIRQGWKSKNPAIRQLWTTLCIPEGSQEEVRSFNDLQRDSVSPENAAAIFEAIGDFDVRSILSELEVPVLVLHSRGDSLVPFEEGRRLAAMIEDAKFAPLDSPNHLLLRHEPAWPVFISEVRKFLGRDMMASGISRLFKHCQACGRTYDDDTLVYCLEDGSRLNAITRMTETDEDKTQVFKPTL